MQEKIRAYMESRREAMVGHICELIRIRSDRQAPEEGMPYGPGPARALEEALRIASDLGFRTHNYENYVGTVDFGDAEPCLDILAHLDVVPAGEGWQVTAPYEPKLVDGRLYGRGSIDDKGPAVCALYAMMAVRDLGLELRRNVRLILGTDEECGSSDIAYYYARQPEAPMTFSPDSDFPIINTEKGRLTAEITASWPEAAGNVRVIEATGGVKANVVPDSASALLSGLNPDSVRQVIRDIREETGLAYHAQAELGNTRVTVSGTSSHAATPHKGNNAVTGLLHLLARLPISDSECAGKIRSLSGLFPHGDWRGEAAGIAQQDEISGELTISLNMLRIDGSGLSATFDSRCPVCATEANMREVLDGRCAESGLALENKPMVPHHHVPCDSPFVRTLLKCYTQYTGKEGRCMTTGGGTYVHDLKNGVAFGCMTPGTEYNLHGIDEFAIVDELVTSACIFTQAIIDLCG